MQHTKCFVSERRKKKKSRSTSSTTTSTISTIGIQRIIEKLKNQQHRDSTRKNYYTVWKIFNKFYIKLDIKPSNWEGRIQLFIGQMIVENKQSSTIRSYLSALRAVLKSENIIYF